jgi:hypothetical protein
MAKETKEAKSRVLSKQIDGCVAIIGGSQNHTITGAEGWKGIYNSQGTGFHIIYNIQTIDLSGYNLQDLTLFPQGILMQDLQTMPQGITSPNPLTRATIVSTTPIEESDLNQIDSGTNQWHLPGSNHSTHSLQNILQGRIQYYVLNQQSSGLMQTSESMWGSGDSTAADKLWLCDAFMIPDTENAMGAAPDQAFVIPSIITEEPELEYMMRLSRSLEPVY